VLWWSPDPRFVLFLDEFCLPKSTLKAIKKEIFQVRIDTDFESVIKECASAKREGQNGTWITDEMIEAYCELHDLGYAHSFESYHEDELVGGLYGVSLGGAFFGESMFCKKRESSRVALHALVEFCMKNGFLFIDSQVKTSHFEKMGAREISRDDYLDMLEIVLKNYTMVGKWEKL